MKLLILTLLISCSTNDFQKEDKNKIHPTSDVIDLAKYKERSKNYKPRFIETSPSEFEEASEENERELVSLIAELQSDEERNFFDLGKRAPPPEPIFILPVTGRISSGYGIRKGKMHHGIDIPGKTGSIIKASNNGKVVYSGRKNGYGQVVILSHLPDIFTIYAHNSKNLVNVGQIVKKGEKIALVGNTGRSTGSHVHFEIRKRTNSIDPIKFIKNQKK